MQLNGGQTNCVVTGINTVSTFRGHGDKIFTCPSANYKNHPYLMPSQLK